MPDVVVPVNIPSIDQTEVPPTDASETRQSIGPGEVSTLARPGDSINANEPEKAAQVEPNRSKTAASTKTSIADHRKPTGTKASSQTTKPLSSSGIATKRSTDNTLTNSTSTSSSKAKATTATRRQSAITTSAKHPLTSSTSKPLSVSTSPRNALSSSLNKQSNGGAALSMSGTSSSVISPSSSTTSSKPRVPVTTPLIKRPTSTKASLSGSSVAVKPTQGPKFKSSISSIKESEDKKDDWESKHHAVSSALQENNATLADLEKQLTEVRNQLSEKMMLQEQLDQTVSSFESLKQERDDLSRSLGDRNTQLDAMQDVISNHDTLLSEMKQSKERVHDLQRIEAEMRAQLEASNSKALAATAEFQSSREAHQRTTQDLTVQSAERDSLLNENDLLKASQEDLMSRLSMQELSIRETESQISQLEASLAAQKKAADEFKLLTKEVETSRNRMTELEMEVLQLKRESGEKDEARMLDSATVDRLEAELAKAQEGLRSATVSAETMHAEHELRYSALQQSHDEEVRGVTESREAVNSQLNDALENLSKLRTEHEKLSAAHQVSLQDQAQALELNARQYEAHVTALKTQLSDNQAEFDNKTKTVESAHSDALRMAFEEGKNTASSEHGRELKSIRTQTQASMEQLRLANQSALMEATTSLEAEAATRLRDSETRLAAQTVDLKATRDDLAKAKAMHQTTTDHLNSLKSELDSTRQALATAEAAQSGASEDTRKIEQLTRELSMANDDLVGVQAAFDATKASMRDMSDRHEQELKEAAESRIHHLSALQRTHDEDVKLLSSSKEELQKKVTELEVELPSFNASATIAKVNPVNGHGSSNGEAVGSPRISKEELSHMHDAHNMRIHSMEAAHNKELQELKESLEAALKANQELESASEHKAMEIHFMEMEGAENADKVNRLEDEVKSLKQLIAEGR